MVDEYRAGLNFDLCDCRHGHLSAALRMSVDGLQGVDGAVGIRIRFHDDAVLIRLRKYGGNYALAKSVVQGVVNRAHTDPQARGAVAVDGNVGRESVVFLIADDIGELRDLAQCRYEFWSPSRQGSRIRAFQRELVLRAADGVIESQILNRLHVQRDARDAR